MSKKDFNQTGALSTTNEWLTPPELIAALGAFDLDPCAPPPQRRPWETAPIMYDEALDGLKTPWIGRVFLNPPYGSETFIWIEKLAAHKSGIALIFARTDTRGFHAEIFNKAHSIFFFKSRLKFSGIVSQAEIDMAAKDDSVLFEHQIKIARAVRKRIKGKTLNRINSDYSWFKGDSANAPSCLISYSWQDTRLIQKAFEAGKIKGRLVTLTPASVDAHTPVVETD